MGEPTPNTHRRNFDFPLWPYDSTADLADYAEWLVALVERDASAPLEVSLTISIYGRDREPPIPIGELRERLDEFPFKEIYEASMKVRDQDDSLTLWLRLISEILVDNRATVTITGTDRNRVLFIKDEVRMEGEARLERRAAKAKAKAAADEEFRRQEVDVGIRNVEAGLLREAKERAEARKRLPEFRAAVEPVTPEPPTMEPAAETHADKSSESRLHRFFYNPWTVTIGGGLLVGVVVLVITLLVAA
jgi:hypothetical protein